MVTLMDQIQMAREYGFVFMLFLVSILNILRLEGNAALGKLHIFFTFEIKAHVFF